MTHPDSTTDSSDRSIQPGMSIGGYKVLSVLGEGGFGVVYLAEREHPVKRRVAIKAIKPGMDSKQILARFEAERQALAVMDHTSVAKVFDAGITESGRSYFVMEYVKGIPITEHCDRLKLGISDRLKLVIQVCEAVQHAHHKGIVHRDLKPRNILVSLEGNRSVCKVIDFGVAKAMAGPLTEKTIYTEQGQIIGTPEYMSPEQAEMTNQDIDTRTDIYSLGVVLYELLTGSQPFTADYLRKGGFDHIRQVIREEEPPTPSTRVTSLDAPQASQITKSRHIELRELRRELQGDLDWITLKAMEKDRQRRYETVNGLAMDIQRYLDNEPIVARPPSSLYRLSKMARRNRVAFLATGAVATALVVGLAAAMWGLTAANFHRDVAEDRQARAETAEREARQERDDAREARRIAVQERAAASRMAETHLQELYAAQINLAHQAWIAGDFVRAKLLLESLRPALNQSDLRGFEWRYLWKLCQDESYRTLGMLTDDDPQGLSFSADGGKLAIADGKIVRVWAFPSRRELPPVARHANSITALVFSSTDPDSLATVDDEGTLKLWDLASEAPPAILAEGIHERVWDLAFSPDGTKLASAINDGRVTMWGIETRSLVWEKEVGRGHWDEEAKTQRPALCVTFSRDGKLVATGGGDTKVRLWDATTGAEMPPLKGEGHTAYVFGLDSSPDRRFLASSAFDSRVILWDLVTRSALPEFLGHSGTVGPVAFSPDSGTLVSGGADRTIRFWNTATLRQTDLLRGHTTRVRNLAFSPDGRWLASASNETVKLWDLPGHRTKDVLTEHSDWLETLALSPDGKTLVTSDFHTQSLKLWDIPSGSAWGDLFGHEIAWALAFSPDGKSLASGGNKSVRLWDPSSGQSIPMPGSELGSRSVSFSPDGTILGAAGKKGLKFWNVASQLEVELIKGDTSSVRYVAFSPKGSLLVTAGEDGPVVVWDATDGKRKTSSEVEFKEITSIAFSSEGKLIAVGQKDGSVALLDVVYRDNVRWLQGHTGQIRQVAFTTDSKTLASASWDSTVRLWNIATGQPALTVKHLGPATGVGFSNTGMLMATCGADGTARIWRAASLSEADAGLNGGDGHDPQ